MLMCRVICMNLYWCVLCWAVSWSGKCCMKKCFFCKNKGSKCMTFFKPPDMLAGQDRCGLFIWESIWLPDCSLILCFYTVSPCCILLLSSIVLVTILCMFSCLHFCRLFLVVFHHVLMLAGFVILRCILRCLSHFVWHLFLYPYLWWACLSPSCGCVGTTSLHWKSWVQVCI